MEESPDSGDKLPHSNEENGISPSSDQTVAVARDLSTSVAESAIPSHGLSVSLNKGSFNRPNFGPQTNTQHVEANQIEYANITHLHTHYHNEGKDSDDEDLQGSKLMGRKDAEAVPEGYVKLSDDTYMYEEKPLKKGTQVFQGYQQYISGQKQQLGIKKIVPCDEKSVREVEHLVNLLPHPNVVQIFRSIPYKSLTHFELYIVMELCKLQNLHDYLAENREKNKPFDFAQTMFHAKQLINGIKHIHANRIIHGDLKPENILFSMDGTQIKVSDFGISKQLRDGRSKTKLTSQGTDGFRAPETFNSDCISMNSDIYSLAVTLYSMFTNGKHPYGEDPYLQVYNMVNNKGLDLSGLPDEMGATMKKLLIDLLGKMLQLDPKKRPDIEEVADHPFFTKSSDASEVTERSQHEIASSIEEMPNPETNKADYDNYDSEKVSVEPVQAAQNPSLRGSDHGKQKIFQLCIVGLCVIVAGLAVAFGLHQQSNRQQKWFKYRPKKLYTLSGMLEENKVEPHLGSKSEDNDISKSLRADFCVAGKGQPSNRTNSIDWNITDVTRKLQNWTGKTDFSRWFLRVFVHEVKHASSLLIQNMHQGIHICHMCAPLKDVKPELFDINMTTGGDLRKFEVIDVLPLYEFHEVMSEKPWDGIIFWFDNKTFELMAANLGGLKAQYVWNLASVDVHVLKPIPLGVPAVILPLQRYKHVDKIDQLVWVRVDIELVGCKNSSLKIFFNL